MRKEDIAFAVGATSKGIHVAGVIEVSAADKVGVILLRRRSDAGEEMEQSALTQRGNIDVEGSEIAGREKPYKISIGSDKAVLISIKAKPSSGPDRREGNQNRRPF